MRDRLIALNMSRAMRIRDDEFNIPMLTLEDFDITDTDRGTPGMSSVFLDTDTQIALAEMCIFMAQLCIPIGDIISLHFSTLPPEGQETSSQAVLMSGGTAVLMNGRTMLFPKFEVNASERVKLYDADIQKLFSARPSCCIYNTPRWRDLGGNGPSMLIHRAYLHMSFFAAVSALHRPQMKSRSQQHSSQVTLDAESQRLSQKRFFEAGREISRACHDLWINNLEDLLPPGAVLIQIAAIMTHIPRVPFHSKEESQYDPLRAIFYSLQVCEALQAAHPGADLVMGFLKIVLKAASIDLIEDGDLKIIDLRYRKNDDPPTSCSMKEVQYAGSLPVLVEEGRRLDRGDHQYLSGLPAETLGSRLPGSFDDECKPQGKVALEMENTPFTDEFDFLPDHHGFEYFDVDLANAFEDIMAQYQLSEM